MADREIQDVRWKPGFGSPETDRSAPGPDVQHGDLHICPACSSHLVQPLEWAPVDDQNWQVMLRCPECEWQHTGLYEQRLLDRYDAILEEAAEELNALHAQLAQENLEDEVGKLTTALDSDLLLPEDF